MDESDRTLEIPKNILLGYDDGDVRFALPWVDQVDEPLAGLTQPGLPTASNPKLALSDYQPAIDQPAFGLTVQSLETPLNSIPVHPSPSAYEYEPTSHLDGPKISFSGSGSRSFPLGPSDYQAQPTNVQAPSSSSSYPSAIPLYYSLDSTTQRPLSLQNVYPTPVTRFQPADPYAVDSSGLSNLHHRQPELRSESPPSSTKSLDSLSSLSNATEGGLTSPTNQQSIWVTTSRPFPPFQPALPTQGSYRRSNELAPVPAAKQPRLSHISPNCNKVLGPAKRTMIACERCRLHKLRCLGGTPCGACERRGLGDACVYVAEVRRRGKGKNKASSPASSSPRKDHTDIGSTTSNGSHTDACGRPQTTAESSSRRTSKTSFDDTADIHLPRPILPPPPPPPLPPSSSAYTFTQSRFPPISSFVSPSGPALLDDAHRSLHLSDNLSFPSLPSSSNEPTRYPSLSSVSSFNGPSPWVSPGCGQTELSEVLPQNALLLIADSHRPGSRSRPILNGPVQTDRQRPSSVAIPPMGTMMTMARMKSSTDSGQLVLTVE
ncbi:Zn(2)-C6 fungal-type DNA-binding domain [Phaffia rhodozyma]|uniref:Zn(2)-C6 fungal-type DNA-binding domain n=1 Tax=Phaffia rhodozyma TaxID=264483 RepID=A0A0F7SUA2_PHARH|nr:Zn(2)-C6 fungal-type DNA-binding domain [Phaffia rhodozyma]